MRNIPCLSLQIKGYLKKNNENVLTDGKIIKRVLKKNPAYGRHWLSRPIQKVLLIQVCVNIEWSSFVPTIIFLTKCFFNKIYFWPERLCVEKKIILTFLLAKTYFWQLFLASEFAWFLRGDNIFFALRKNLVMNMKKKHLWPEVLIPLR